MRRLGGSRPTRGAGGAISSAGGDGALGLDWRFFSEEGAESLSVEGYSPRHGRLQSAPGTGSSLRDAGSKLKDEK